MDCLSKKGVIALPLTDLRKYSFLNFCLFHFSKFQEAIVKHLMEKPSLFIMDSEGSYELLLIHKYFWSTNFWQWNDGPLKWFEICTEMHFISLFFLNERNIATSIWWYIKMYWCALRTKFFLNIYQSIVFERFRPVLLCSPKWQTFKGFVNYMKVLF